MKDRDKYVEIAQEVEDAVEGEKAVKAKTTRYLPKLTGMYDAEDGDDLYNSFIGWAKWFPATGRTFDAYQGSLFRKQPINNLKGLNKDFITDFTDIGDTLEAGAREISGNLMKHGMGMVLVDYPSIDTTTLTLAQANNLGIKPYAIIYNIFQIADWVYDNTFGRKILRSVTLEEQHEVTEPQYIQYVRKEAVEEDSITIRRKVYLDDNMIYKQDIYLRLKKSNNEYEYSLVDTKTPTINGEPLNFLPVVPFNETGLVFKYQYPMLFDISSVNYVDYRNDALLRNIYFLVGRPMPWVVGLKPEESNSTGLQYGSSRILELENGGQCGMLGGDATSASALYNESVRLKQEMSTIGSRSLAADPNGVEAARTAEIHRMGETGCLSTIAKITSSVIRRSLWYMFKWMNEEINEENIQYEIQTDFVPNTIESATMAVLFEQYMLGKIPLEVLFYNLRKSDLLPDSMTKESFEANLVKKEPMEEVKEDTSVVEVLNS